MKFLILALFYIFSALTLKAQQNEIKGVVLSEKGLALQNASVMLIRGIDSVIVTYTITDPEGHFLLKWIKHEGNSSTYHLKISLLGFASKEFDIDNLAGHNKFVLQTQDYDLKEVEVKSKLPFVKGNGDTTTYRTADFASAQDQSIGDVLRRIPGITVEENGFIQYNGQQVSRLYLDGDDLLEARYGIATKKLPNRVVEKIQVLENHQRIKVLQGKVFSDEVDINLVLNDKSKLHLIGRVELKGGTPDVYNGNGNFISLKNRYKAIQDVSLNNSGESILGDILALDEMRESVKRGYRTEKPLMSIEGNNEPPIDKSRYLFNQSGGINSSNLLKLSSDVQLKSKWYYQEEQQDRSLESITEVFTPTDLIRFSEHNDYHSKIRNLYGDMILYANTEQRYVVNKLSYDMPKRLDRSFLNALHGNIDQRTEFSAGSLSNELNLLRTTKKEKVIEFYSFAMYNKNRESLLVDSPYLTHFFIQNPSELKAIHQLLETSSIFTNNYVIIRSSKRALSYSHKLGFSTNFQKLNSDLKAHSGDSLIAAKNGVNRLNWEDYSFYSEPNFEWQGGYFQITGKLPMQYIMVKASDQGFSKDKTALFTNYNFNAHYKKHGFYASVFFSRSRKLGTPRDYYQGIILHNYRSVRSNASNFRTSTNYLQGFSIRLKNAPQILTISLRATYSLVNANTIPYTTLSDSTTYTQNLNGDYFNNIFNIDFSGSKYFFPIKVTGFLDYSWQRSRSNKLVNDSPYGVISLQDRLKIGVRGIVENFRYLYSFQLQQFESFPSNRNSVNSNKFLIHNNAHVAELEYNFTSSFFLNVKGNLLTNKSGREDNVTCLFSDMSIRKKFKKPDVQISFECQNLTNRKLYKVASNSSNIQYFNSFLLRERMIFIKATFSI